VARTRTLTDEEILDRVGAALGDAEATWTLAGAAASVGLHSATLIKRFGSRHGLLVALSERWMESQPTSPTTADPYRELMAWAESFSPAGVTGAQLLTRVDMLVEDLRDPELRALLHVSWQRNLRYLTELIDLSQEAGQISSAAPSKTLAQLLLDTAHGGLLRAAVDPDPTDTTPVKALLEALK